MKQFFNLPTSAMLVIIVIAMIVAFLSSVVNWVAVIWMFVSAMWVVIARLNELISDDRDELYNSTVEDLAKLWKKYKTLNNDYLNLTKRNEEIYKENAQLLERIAGLRKQHDDTVAIYGTAAQKPATKKPGPKATKREYTEQDRTRIREEMKTVGVKTETKSPVENED